MAHVGNAGSVVRRLNLQSSIVHPGSSGRVVSLLMEQLRILQLVGIGGSVFKCSQLKFKHTFVSFNPIQRSIICSALPISIGVDLLLLIDFVVLSDFFKILLCLFMHYSED